MVERIYQLASQHAEFASQVHHGHMRDKKWLQGHIDRLANQNRTSLRALPAPVGRTVRLMQIGSDKENYLIDEPTAEVLRSHDLVEVGDAQEYEAKIVGVFKTNRTCRIKLLSGKDMVVPGKIIDPVVDQPNNIYTKALNEDFPLRVVAKPILKDGKLQKLFISDAKPLKPPRRSRKKAS